MKKIRVLVCQYKINYLKPEVNILKFERLIRKYRYLKSDLVIFPEYALTGPLYGNYHLALKVDDQIYERLRKMAQKYDTNIIPGSFARRVGTKILNSSCFIDANGRMSDFYNKHILWNSEKRFLTPGNSTGIFDTKIGRIAIQICADLNSAKISGVYQAMKPELVVNLAMWSEEDMKATKKKVPNDIEMTQTGVLVRARSLEAKAYTIFCNFSDRINITTKTRRTYCESSIGNTMIVNPYGEIISKVSGNKEQVLVSELDLFKCHWANY